MADVKNLLLATAGAAGGAGENIESLFSTTLYEGTGSSGNNIVNGLDLSTEGGWSWFKRINGGSDHFTVDNVRGLTKYFVPNSTTEGFTHSNVTYNTNGFTLNDNLGDTNDGTNASYVNYSFRRAPKFFDIVQYTGSGSAKTVSHNLGSVPGMIITKRIGTEDWGVYHRSLDKASPAAANVLHLNLTSKQNDSVDFWNNTEPTDSVFSVGTSNVTNGSGADYIAYIFAHHDGDGTFGPTGDQDIIHCGVYTGDGQIEGPTINLGFEPQWILFKCSTANEGWYIVDNMKEWTANGEAHAIRPNVTSTSTFDGNSSGVRLNATGFQMSNNSADNNGNNQKYIYMAIRRGPMAEPTSGGDVFAAANGNSSGEPAFTSGFPVDLGIWHGDVSSTNENRASSRLTQGRTMDTDSTATEQASSSWAFDYMNGFMSSGGSGNFATMWRRAPSYFDVVCYTGSSSNQNITHNLGAVPEMIWFKRRDTFTADWAVYHVSLGNDKALMLNTDNSYSIATNSLFNSTTPTASVFTVGANQSKTNNVDRGYVAYVFGSLSGISKCGGYTGTGNDINIDCGFSSGARFVLIKRWDRIGGSFGSVGDWYVYDSTRGIVSGNDPYIFLNDDAAEVTDTDFIDPHSSGFTVTSSAPDALNASGGTYIFYAIAT